MEWIEVRARTLEEAKERALDALGVHESELEYEVLAEPRRTMLGLRRTEAHIRARVKPLSREKPSDRRRRRGREERPNRSRDRNRNGGGRKPANGAAPAADRPTEPSAAPPKPRAAAKPAPTARRAPDAPPPEDAVAEAAGEGEDGATTTPSSAAKRRRRRGGRGRSRSGRPASGAGDTPERDDDALDDLDLDARHSTEELPMPTDTELADIADRTRTFLEGFLDAIELDGTVSVTTTDAAVECSVAGADLGAVVGVKGATLTALEELLRDAVGHHAPGVRIHLDVAGYRARRRAALTDFAVRVANEVVASGAAKALEPMPAADRKVVHDAVAGVEGAATTSDGEEPRRRVIIQPAG